VKDLAHLELPALGHKRNDCVCPSPSSRRFVCLRAMSRLRVLPNVVTRACRSLLCDRRDRVKPVATSR
jgi:hypothetical protein